MINILMIIITILLVIIFFIIWSNRCFCLSAASSSGWHSEQPTVQQHWCQIPFLLPLLLDRDSEDAAIMEDLSKHLPSMQSEHLCKSLDQDHPRKDWQRLLSHPKASQCPTVSVSLYVFFNLSRSNSVLIFPACRKENSIAQWHYALHWLQNQAQLPPQSVLK